MTDAKSSGAIIYSSSTGGNPVQKKEQRVIALCKAQKIDPVVVYLDMKENADKKEWVFKTSGKKGVYPLLFIGEKFIGVSRAIAKSESGC